MELTYGGEYETFRGKLREFIAQNRHLSPGERERNSDTAAAWQKLLIANGYAARAIPEKYGGFGAEPDPLISYIIGEEAIKTALALPCSFNSSFV